MSWSLVHNSSELDAKSASCFWIAELEEEYYKTDLHIMRLP
jgi:hypothetical protein